MITKAQCERLIHESREKHTGGISISIPQELEGISFVPVDYLNKVVYPMAQALDEAMDALVRNNLLFTEFECEKCGSQKATDSDIEFVIDMKPERKDKNGK